MRQEHMAASCPLCLMVSTSSQNMLPFKCRWTWIPTWMICFDFISSWLAARMVASH
jgi:hypothetical protein